MAYEVRAAGNTGLTFTVVDGKPRIDARAIVFDSWSVDLGGFRERMRPGSVQLDPDLVALFDHDTSMVLGRVSAGTMDVRSDEAGVAFSAYPPETTWAADLRVSMERGDIRGCSYRMFVDEDTWYVENGIVCRDVRKARVSELTITSMPAYPQTTAEARSHAAELAKETPVEERAGRVLSTTNEMLVKAAIEGLSGVEAGVDAIEAAVELVRTTLVSVVQQIDPTYVPEDDGCDCEDPCTDPNCTCSDPNCAKCSPTDSGNMGGASMNSRSSAGAAESKKAGTFVPGFGFIPTKGK